MTTVKFSPKASIILLVLFAVLVVLSLLLKSTYWTKEKINELVIEVSVPESVKEIEKKENPGVEQLKAIWRYVYDKKYICTDEEYLGGKMGVDGAYYLCKEKKFWPYPNPGGDRCLVYSFGINNDFKFDDAIAKTGCEVHAFDPSMSLADETVRDSGVIFHKIGIAESDNDHGYNGWKMRTLKTLMKELGHQNRVLDYLKVDTDKLDWTGFEDTVMQEILDNGMYQCVRQYAMEIHMFGPLANDKNMKRCKTIYQQMIDLQKGGWLLYQNVDNVRARQEKNPDDTQDTVKMAQFAGGSDIVLWETHFVNTNLKGKCGQFL